ncbi:RES family NAD+ phosphorylase [Desertihabitans brevis]|uniref:RES family NAD+ phosphorylase n=1 Tax=Desertihabitans brevis TaxID=2268447 RepID=UPI0013140075|nr:RES family NAD+ phosphorylase [Desertihabitans brevis]
MTTPPPPDPFDAAEEVLTAGTALYRVGSTRRPLHTFNPGVGSGSRFAFFGDPPVPVLYAADTATAALTETLLHDIPVTGGLLTSDAYTQVVMGRLLITRDLRLASLRGLGLQRRLRVEASQLTDTPSSEYPRTVRWAEAAHRAGFDGLAWTSRLCNDSRAVVLFGDRAGDAVVQDVCFGRYFHAGPGLDWLIDTCAPLHVDVLPPS